MLDPYQGGERFNVSVSGESNSVTARWVRYGDVYLCSGQSNMVKSVAYLNGSAEITAAGLLKKIVSFMQLQTASASEECFRL